MNKVIIYKDRIIHVEWTIYKGLSLCREDFNRALLSVFLIGKDKYHIENAVAERGVIKFDVPQGLPECVYSVEAIWVKNRGNFHDCRYNDRCVNRSRMDYLFAITEYEDEATNIGEGEVKVRAKSSVATYGYDGLSAYEIAVMRGDFTGSEEEWIEDIMGGTDKYSVFMTSTADVSSLTNAPNVGNLYAEISSEQTLTFAHLDKLLIGYEQTIRVKNTDVDNDHAVTLPVSDTTNPLNIIAGGYGEIHVKRYRANEYRIWAYSATSVIPTILQVNPSILSFGHDGEPKTPI